MKLRNRKATVAIILAIMLVIVSGAVFDIRAQTYGDYEYVTKNSGIEISGYKGAGGEISIPSVIDGKLVVGIRSNANYAGGVFYKKGITSVEIPSTVTYIGNFAFNSNVIESLSIGSGVETIEHGAFETNKLTSVEIPDGLTSIGTMAFARNSIKSVEIPESVTSIGNNSFSENQADPKELTVYGKSGSQAETFANANGYTFNTSMVAEYTYEIIDGGNEIRITEYKGSGGDIEIPEEIDGYRVVEIGSESFKSKAITGVKIPDTVKSIGKMAFESNSISSLVIPDSVESIGVVAFSNNEISSLEMGRGLRTIGSRSFSNNKIESLVIPDNVDSINYEAFLSNEISNVVIPKTVETIDSDAFEWNQTYSSDLTICGEMSSSISDFDSIPESYQIYVLKAYSIGLLSGYPDGEFKGGNTLNRAEAATIALRVFEHEK